MQTFEELYHQFRGCRLKNKPKISEVSAHTGNRHSKNHRHTHTHTDCTTLLKVHLFSNLHIVTENSPQENTVAANNGQIVLLCAVAAFKRSWRTSRLVELLQYDSADFDQFRSWHELSPLASSWISAFVQCFHQCVRINWDCVDKTAEWRSNRQLNLENKRKQAVSNRDEDRTITLYSLH